MTDIVNLFIVKLRDYKFLVGLNLLLLFNYVVPFKSLAQSEKPNVIFILADQWRADAVGYAGNTDVITPNLDRLAKESLVFDNAVTVMAVCAPWRASFLTGQYPLTNGVFYNDKPLPSEALTMAEIYKEQGYQTGYIGKWHLNGHKRGEDAFSARDKPVTKDRRQGFDYWKVREVTHDYNNSFYFDENDEKQYWKGYDAFSQTDSAISYIKKNKDNPFLLMMSWGPPHNPYQTAPQEYQEMYDAASLTLRPNVPENLQDSARKVIAGYYAHITALDKAMGDLIETLESEGLTENTILVFTSEHGDMLFSKGFLRKQRPWDESIKVPMLIRYPDKINKSRKIKGPIDTPDLLPTLLGLSDISIPNSIEGTDFSSALLSGKDIENDGALIMLPVPFHEWNFSNGGREYRGIRTERYTYVKDLQGPWLLYDNKKDPFQNKNLINQSAYSELQDSLEKILQAKLDDTNDSFLPADDYMSQWNYLYDKQDSIRAPDYLQMNR
ncbi:sulfatase family protein [Algoriphagus chordae]|uniref:Arylsulfatase A-like enzyme n=1 Tax=Algoriphagus chordae TaxID=237019 RepID=A0A2W7RQM5_9BACT|nr:sulfatase [Algoriphagus chordae]PZX56779.1 arylsulfatase A-like enzyme [Algoriphagus chordae]